jgi:hypothetical protein
MGGDMTGKSLTGDDYEKLGGEDNILAIDIFLVLGSLVLDIFMVLGSLVLECW